MAKPIFLFGFPFDTADMEQFKTYLTNSQLGSEYHIIFYNSTKVEGKVLNAGRKAVNLKEIEKIISKKGNG